VLQNRELIRRSDKQERMLGEILQLLGSRNGSHFTSPAPHHRDDVTPRLDSVATGAQVPPALSLDDDDMPSEQPGTFTVTNSLPASLKGITVIGAVQGWYIDQWYNTLTYIPHVNQRNTYKSIKFCVEYLALFMDHHIEPPPQAAWTSAAMRHWQGDVSRCITAAWNKAREFYEGTMDSPRANTLRVTIRGSRVSWQRLREHPAGFIEDMMWLEPEALRRIPETEIGPFCLHPPAGKAPMKGLNDLILRNKDWAHRTHKQREVEAKIRSAEQLAAQESAAAQAAQQSTA
jgi:hypothetical protein